MNPRSSILHSRRFRLCHPAFLAAVLALATAGCQSLPRQDAFRNWPAEADPARVGKLVAENFADRKLDFETDPKRRYVIYPEACAW